jgi:hypothetical protein
MQASCPAHCSVLDFTALLLLARSQVQVLSQVLCFQTASVCVSALGQETIGNTADCYSGGAGFKFWPEHQLYRLRIFMVLLSPFI